MTTWRRRTTRLHLSQEASNARFELTVCGIAVTQDDKGNVCLSDLWRLGGADGNRRPNKWWRGQAAKDLTSALVSEIGRNSPNLAPYRKRRLFQQRTWQICSHVRASGVGAGVC